MESIKICKRRKPRNSRSLRSLGASVKLLSARTTSGFTGNLRISPNFCYAETSPGPNCMVTKSLTNPYHIVKLAKQTKEIKFNVTEMTNNCEAYGL